MIEIDLRYIWLAVVSESKLNDNRCYEIPFDANIFHDFCYILLLTDQDEQNCKEFLLD